MRGMIIDLDVTENPKIEIASIEELHRSVGPKLGQQMIERVIFEMDDRLWKVKEALFHKDMCEAQRQSRRLAAISEQIGLFDFARVARDLYNCISTQDRSSIASVSARLQRVGTRSLYCASRLRVGG